MFCDDLSFDNDDTSYKSLKAVLDGGVEGRPENVIFYATSNRRHLMSRDMIGERTLDRDQSRRGGRGESIAVGSFRPVARLPPLQPGRIPRHGRRLCQLSQPEGRCRDELRREALEWATTRGSRSGRVAWQFIQELAGRLGVTLKDD